MRVGSPNQVLEELEDFNHVKNKHVRFGQVKNELVKRTICCIPSQVVRFQDKDFIIMSPVKCFLLCLLWYVNIIFIIK